MHAPFQVSMSRSCILYSFINLGMYGKLHACMTCIDSEVSIAMIHHHFVYSRILFLYSVHIHMMHVKKWNFDHTQVSSSHRANMEDAQILNTVFSCAQEIELETFKSGIS